MAQIFPPSFNKLPLAAAIVGGLVPVLAVAGIWYFFSPWYTDVGYQPVQPVPYSHKLHVGELGLDCHRDPGPNRRPVSEVTNMKWTPPRDTGKLVAQLDRQRRANPPTDCSGCHR